MFKPCSLMRQATCSANNTSISGPRPTSKIMNRIVVNFFLLPLWLIACGGADSSTQSNTEGPYRLHAPDRIYELPDELEEISGLSTLSAGRLLANEDETGTLFVYNIEEGALEETFSWGEDKDYEGVTVSGNTAFVLQSNGDIFAVRNFRSPGPEVQEYENDALEDCDAEGLSWLPETRQLLIACKEGQGGSRNIHAFELEQEELNPEPFLQLSFQEIEEDLLQTGLDKLSLKLRKLLGPKGGSEVLFPSGIAVHPLSGDYYILSAKTKLLVVFTAEGSLKKVYELGHEHFLQPEAITFTANGDLYIGNEGKGGKPNILKFIHVEKQ